MSTATLCVACSDQPGLVAAFSDFVFRHGGNVIHADQHTDTFRGRFALRLQFELAKFELDRAGIDLALQGLGERFHASCKVAYSDAEPRVAVFASKQPHCLYDLLLRQQMQELPGRIAVVISNHEDCRGLVEHFGIKYHCIPIDSERKADAEAVQRALLDEHQIDTVVLARYMQVLSQAFVQAWAGRIINIHHSFLPAFVGAKPYHQAKQRGVKVIGATAHYVTAELDQGPIISQDVIAVSHRDSVADLIRKGRDIERRVLANALRLHLDHRVFVEDNATIVFE